MAKKITKQINSQFNPTEFDGFMPIYACGGYMKKHGFGGKLFSGIKDFGADYLKYMGDQALSLVGARDVISDDDYNTKLFQKVTPFMNAGASAIGMIGANALAPGVGGQLMGSLQGVTGQLGTSAAELEQQKMAEMQSSNSAVNVPGHPQYAATFGYGGRMIPIQGTIPGTQLDTSQLEPMNRLQPEQISRMNDMSSYYNQKARDEALMEYYQNTGNNRPMSNPLNELIRGQLPSNKKELGGSIDNGGTHEQNPNGGVPIGKGALVEEGEYIYNSPKGKYVFSNRF